MSDTNGYQFRHLPPRNHPPAIIKLKLVHAAGGILNASDPELLSGCVFDDIEPVRFALLLSGLEFRGRDRDALEVPLPLEGFHFDVTIELSPFIEGLDVVAGVV